MHKFLFALLIIFSLCFFAGCGDKGKDGDKAGKEKPKADPEKEAKAALEKLIAAANKEDEVEVKKYMMKSDIAVAEKGPQGIKIFMGMFKAFKIDKMTAEVSEDGKTVTFTQKEGDEEKEGQTTLTVRMLNDDGQWKFGMN